MMKTLIRTIQTQFHSLTRTSRRRRQGQSVSPEQLEARLVLSAVVEPVVDYTTAPADVAEVGQSIQLNDSIVIFTMTRMA